MFVLRSFVGGKYTSHVPLIITAMNQPHVFTAYEDDSGIPFIH